MDIEANQIKKGSKKKIGHVNGQDVYSVMLKRWP